MLEINNVDFNYGLQPVFEDLNLTIKAGEFVFLIGKSGTGKSTLMQLIYMNLMPKSGSIRIDDYNSDTITAADIPKLRRKLGIVFQDFKLLEDRNVFDNLAFVLQVTGTERSKIKKKVISALADVGLSHKSKSMPGNLSGGEKQRVAIARAIINEPMMILADEPTGNLDPETSEEIFSILKRINIRGTSVLLATHNYDLVRKLDTRIIKLSNYKAVNVILKKKTEESGG